MSYLIENKETLQGHNNYFLRSKQRNYAKKIKIRNGQGVEENKAKESIWDILYTY